MTTIDFARPNTSITPSVWTQVDEGLWAGRCGGEFLGTIERTEASRYFARDHRRSYVGEYTTLQLAQQQLTSLL